MFTFNTNKLLGTVPALTQARSLQLANALALTAAKTAVSEVRAQPFNAVLMASSSADRFYDVGQGILDAAAYTRIIEQYAYSSGLSYMELSLEFNEYLLRASRNMQLWVTIMTGIMGVAGKNIRKNMAIKVLPAHIHEQVAKHFPTKHAPFSLLVADYVAGMLAPLGWVLNSQGYSYHITRRDMFPTALDLVKSLRSKKVATTINILSTAKLGIFQELVNGDALSVVPLAHAIATSLSIAAEQATVEYDPYKIVKSVMHKLIRVWDPRTPKELMPSERVLKTAGFEECRNNLSLFLIAQEMLSGPMKEGDSEIDWMEPFVDFSDEEFASIVMKYFYEAIITDGAYQVRRLDEVTSSVGSMFACDAQRHPVHLAMYEVLRPETEATVFKPIQTGAKGVVNNLRYLMVDSELSAKYTDALKSSSEFFDIRKMVKDRIESYENLAASAKNGLEGLSMTLLLPSVMEREAAFNRPFDLLRKAIAGATDDEILEGLERMIASSPDTSAASTDVRVLSPADHLEGIRRRARDVYAYVVAMAVHAAQAEIGSCKRDDGRNLVYLTWTMTSSLRKTLGESALMGSQITTNEPLEALAYAMTQHPTEPTTERVVQPPMLALHQDAMHLWNWHAASMSTSYEQKYVTELSGKTYTVLLNEKHMMGMFYEKAGVRLMRPVVARAAVVTWLELWRADLQFLRASREATKDPLVRAAIDGRLLQTRVDIVARLIALSKSSVGARAAGRVTSTIRNAMYDTGELDEYTAMHTVVQRLILAVNTGIWVIELLGLVTAEESAALVEEVRDPRVLQLSLALLNGPK